MKKLASALSAALLLAGGCASAIHTQKLSGDILHLYLAMPKAASVELVSSAKGYAPVPARKNKHGVWEVEVPGAESFDYFYIVDGEPYTPPGGLSRPDGFGGRTAIYDPGM